MSLFGSMALVLITVPAFNLLWTKHDEYNHHFMRYNKRTFARMANGTDIRIGKMKYFFHWTFPVKMLVRAKEAVFRGDPKPAEVPHSIINITLQDRTGSYYTTTHPVWQFLANICHCASRDGDLSKLH